MLQISAGQRGHSLSEEDTYCPGVGCPLLFLGRVFSRSVYTAALFTGISLVLFRS